MVFSELLPSACNYFNDQQYYCHQHKYKIIKQAIACRQQTNKQKNMNSSEV